MGTDLAAPLSLPKIDLSSDDLSPGTTTWDLVRGDVFRALKEYGCFEAVYGGKKTDPDQLSGSVMEQLEEVFNLPSETKRRFVKPGDVHFFGYRESVPSSPLYENMAMGEVLDSPAVQSLGDLLWPDHSNPKFCETINTCARKAAELDLLVKRLAFEALGVEKYLDSHIEHLTHSMTLSKYISPNTMEDQIGMGIHTDKNFLTILQQNHVDGLDVQAKDGRWIRATPSPSTFIVIVGELFLGWSNGRLHCPRHRVMIKGDQARYSIGLFSKLRGMIKCPEELVDEEHPMLFKPFDEIGLFRFFQTEEGYKAESTIRAYCGI